MDALFRRVSLPFVLLSILCSTSPCQSILFGRFITPFVLGAGGYISIKYGPSCVRLNAYYDVTDYVAAKKKEPWYAQTRDLNESLLHDLKSLYGNTSVVSLPEAWLLNAVFAFSADIYEARAYIAYLEQDTGPSLGLPTQKGDVASELDWKKALLKDLYAMVQGAQRYISFIKEQSDYTQQKDQYLDEYVASISREIAMIKDGRMRKPLLNFCKRIFNWDFINSFTKE